MPPHEVILRGREAVAERTLAFHFSKPPGFRFSAGQAVDIELTDPSRPADVLKHTFSLSSAPREMELTIATRMRDSQFKRVLANLPIGGRAQLEGPFGSFTRDEDRNRAAVFIAGGIGITPFRSMLRDAPPAAERAPIALFYSNPRPRDAAFLGELQALAAGTERLILIATMTKMEGASPAVWRGETGRITPRLLDRHTRELIAPIYYVVGPPAMVGGIRMMLASVGIQDGDIRSEEFFGY